MKWYIAFEHWQIAAEKVTAEKLLILVNDSMSSIVLTITTDWKVTKLYAISHHFNLSTDVSLENLQAPYSKFRVPLIRLQCSYTCDSETEIMFWVFISAWAHNGNRKRWGVWHDHTLLVIAHARLVTKFSTMQCKCVYPHTMHILPMHAFVRIYTTMPYMMEPVWEG